MKTPSTLLACWALVATPGAAQTPGNPFPDPIPPRGGVIEVGVAEFARIPDLAGSPARAMHLVTEPATRRIFVVDMRGPLYAMGPDGGSVTEYVDLDDWVGVEAGGRERGVQSFAFHPHFGTSGEAGHGRFYVWTDTDETGPPPDFAPSSDDDSHETVLLEFTASDPTAASYDGGAPRELMRFQQPYGNHNGGQIAFNPLAEPGDEDFGLLYVGIADGGSGGDPLGMAQDRTSGFGKLFRIDPLGSSSANGAYGIPRSNPFANGGDRGALASPRSGDGVTFPVAEYDHADPLLGSRAASTGVIVYRRDDIGALRDRVLWGDLPSGEIFHFPADELPGGGQDALGRVLLDDGGGARTLLELVQAENLRQGRDAATRVDLRIGAGLSGEVLLLNKHDGVIRVLKP